MKRPVSSTPDAPPRRFRGPRELGSLLPPLTRPCFRKHSPAGARLMAEWNAAAGPVWSALAVPKKMSAGTLTLSCSATAAAELHYAIPQLRERINQWSGEALVRHIRFVHEEPQPARASAAKNALADRKQPRSVSPLSLPDLPEGPVRDALEALGARIRHGR
ncbi:DUF721 domain-containing protein [Acetobacter sp. AN02]|uniref:DUF721 domain-containing protein n=1 Tax=Acetobacter sp. AN02 TaxID=2894186 RepID=UPI002434400D|nr:DUF721 domain-containing protein [Acetobacter sp. AN02]MDG6095457.1 DUF721 domain-containing protein [Acetobacter sp. AN02]